MSDSVCGVICRITFATKKRKVDKWERLRDEKIKIPQIIEISQKQWIQQVGYSSVKHFEYI